MMNKFVILGIKVTMMSAAVSFMELLQIFASVILSQKQSLSQWFSTLLMQPHILQPIFSGVRRKFSWGGFHSAKIFLCTKIESMIKKNIKKAAIQYVNVVKQL